MKPPAATLDRLIGGMDLYLVDQLLRGRIAPGSRIFDAGCGGGRNLRFFLEHGYEVAAIDSEPAAVEVVRELAARLQPELPPDRFRCEAVEASSFEDGWADVVISSAVVHFARDRKHFEAMVEGSWRVLRAGGLFFCRVATRTGLDPGSLDPLGSIETSGAGRYRTLDGSEWYLTSEAELRTLGERLGGVTLDPIKSTRVEGLRAMATWVLQKR